VAFSANEPWPRETRVRITISCCDPPATVVGQVVWCEPAGERYEVGVAFLNTADAYRMRLIEQACHIQQYRLDQVVQEGRYLTLDEAAQEWIQKYAPTSRRLITPHHERVISVPTPSSVKISRSVAWATRPSMMCADCTPPLTASRAQRIFGSIPP